MPAPDRRNGNQASGRTRSLPKVVEQLEENLARARRMGQINQIAELSGHLGAEYSAIGKIFPIQMIFLLND